ncbi:MAG: transcription elongation factor GreA [Actinomycetales bacterium]|nr:transcription elongation factor GreA [Actinomycetales bacterium]
MNETWLTQRTFDRLKAELEELSGPVREEIKNRIAAAREEGDLKENGGYHAAREEQGKNEARIRQLTTMLETATTEAPDVQDGIVSQGMIVTVEFTDLADTETFLLGSHENARDTAVDVYSPASPLGAAVLGQEVGSEISYETPNGKKLNIKILNIKIISAEIYQG